MLRLLNISCLRCPRQVKALDARLLMGSVSQKALLLQEELRSNRARYAKFSPLWLEMLPTTFCTLGRRFVRPTLAYKGKHTEARLGRNELNMLRLGHPIHGLVEMPVCLPHHELFSVPISRKYQRVKQDQSKPIHPRERPRRVENYFRGRSDTRRRQDVMERVTQSLR